MTRSRPAISVFIASVIFLAGCAGTGSISSEYDEEFYKIEDRLPEGRVKGPAKFVVYGDNQGSWQLEKAFSKTSWTDRKMFIFPFYQLYLLGRGVTGTVNWYRRVPDFGGKERREVRDAIFEKVTSGEVTFVLNIGDVCAHDGRRPSHWRSFLQENRVEVPLVDSVPYIAIKGNHEVTNDREFGEKNYEAVFGLPGFDTIELDEALIILLDSNLMVDQKQLIDDDEQDALFSKYFVSEGNDGPSWLEQQLDSAEKSFIIIAMHHPLVTFAGHAHDWTNEHYGRDMHEKRLKLLRLLSSKGVDLVFSGHDHLYQHTRYTDPDGRSTSFIIGGGGGAWLRRLQSEEDMEETRRLFSGTGDVVRLVSSARMNHFEMIDVSAGSIRVEVMRPGSGATESSIDRVIEFMSDGSFRDEPTGREKDSE